MYGSLGAWFICYHVGMTGIMLLRLGWVAQRPEERVDILAQHAQNNLQRVAGSSLKVCFAVQPPNADFVLRVVGWARHFVTYVTV